MASPPVRRYPTPGTLDDVLGFELLEAGADWVRGRFPVEDRVKQPLGLVHGGAYAALAESLVSATTFMAVAADGKIAVGQSNHTSFLRPVLQGSVHADAKPKHRGRTSWVWDVEFTDDEGRLCALTRMTMAVRDAPGS